MSATPCIIITKNDLERLELLIARGDVPATERLDEELARARVVSQHEIASDVVTMNSDVVCEDVNRGVRRNVRVVYPGDADAERGWVSVLAPLGSALLGLRVGQEIDWRMPSGKRRVRVVAVPYQPEANGDYSL